eukprot:350616-Chlamydomonas_euryale.AAC.6
MRLSQLPPPGELLRCVALHLLPLAVDLRAATRIRGAVASHAMAGSVPALEGSAKTPSTLLGAGNTRLAQGFEELLVLTHLHPQTTASTLLHLYTTERRLSKHWSDGRPTGKHAFEVAQIYKTHASARRRIRTACATLPAGDPVPQATPSARPPLPAGDPVRQATPSARPPLPAGHTVSSSAMRARLSLAFAQPRQLAHQCRQVRGAAAAGAAHSSQSWQRQRQRQGIRITGSAAAAATAAAVCAGTRNTQLLPKRRLAFRRRMQRLPQRRNVVQRRLQLLLLLPVLLLLLLWRLFCPAVSRRSRGGGTAAHSLFQRMRQPRHLSMLRIQAAHQVRAARPLRLELLMQRRLTACAAGRQRSGRRRRQPGAAGSGTQRAQLRAQI